MTMKEITVAAPEILGSLRSTYTRVVCIACEEKRIDYRLVETPLGAPELLAVHPFGRMPVMRHGDYTLSESKAIATYLDRVFPGPLLIPSDATLAGLTEQWISLVNSVMDRTLIRTYLLAYAAPRTTDGKPDRAAIDAVLPAVREQIAILDKAVAETGYLVGDQFTLADINLLPILHYVRQVPEGAEAIRAARHLSGYWERHSARPSLVVTTPQPGPPDRYRSP